MLLRHAVHFWQQPFTHEFWNLWYNGWLGVDLFFVLSGFLITHHLLRNWPAVKHKAFIYRYLSKRALRILPLYFFVLMVTTLGIVPYFEPDYPITAYTWLVHTVFLQDYISGVSILVSLWSLGVEEKFYLIAPILVFWAYKYNTSKVIAGTIIVILCLLTIRTAILITISNSITYSQFFWSFRAPFHFSITSVLCGTLVALLYQKHQLSLLTPRLKKVFFYATTAVLLLILTTKRWIESGHWVETNIIIVLSSVLFALLLYCSLAATAVSENLLTKVLRYIAKLAFPLYLAHLMVVPLAKAICNSVFSSTETISFVVYFPVYLGLSLFTAIALHLLVEKPFLELKDRL